MLEQPAALVPVFALLYASIAVDLAVWAKDTEADNLISLLDQFFNEPFESELGVVVLIVAAEEGARAPGVFVVFVFGGYGKGEIAGVLVVEGIKADAGLVGTAIRDLVRMRVLIIRSTTQYIFIIREDTRHVAVTRDDSRQHCVREMGRVPIIRGFVR